VVETHPLATDVWRQKHEGVGHGDIKANDRGGGFDACMGVSHAVDMHTLYGWSQRLLCTWMDEVVVLVEKYGRYESQYEAIQSAL
jgi:hypothetical protein